MDHGSCLGIDPCDRQFLAYMNMRVKTQENGGEKSHMVLVDYPIKLSRKRPQEYIEQNPQIFMPLFQQFMQQNFRQFG